MMKVIIDRFEGDYAVCETENKDFVNILKNELPVGIKEGDMLVLQGDKCCIDKESTTQRKEEIKNKLNSLFVD